MRSILVVYHECCPDGAMAAAVALRALRQQDPAADVALLPARYDRPIAEVVDLDRARGAVVFVLDFSFSPEDTARLAGAAAEIVVLDHHKSAIERFAGWPTPSNVELVLDAAHSGAGLAWRYFYGAQTPPMLVIYVEDYDLWRHIYPASRAVHAYLRSLDMDVDRYTALLDDYSLWIQPEKVVTEGEVILRANDQQARVLARDPETVSISGFSALAANASLHQDDVGHALATRNEDGLGVCWYWRGGRYKVSLRSVDRGGESVDCSVVARLHGGGGHRGAASFHCDKLPWKK